MKIDPILSAIIDTADAANATPDDYINPEDGLKYCGKCHTPKEAYFADNPPFCGIDRHPAESKCAAVRECRYRKNLCGRLYCKRSD